MYRQKHINAIQEKIGVAELMYDIAIETKNDKKQ
jgi:hypothetical protein